MRFTTKGCDKLVQVMLFNLHTTWILCSISWWTYWYMAPACAINVLISPQMNYLMQCNEYNKRLAKLFFFCTINKTGHLSSLSKVMNYPPTRWRWLLITTRQSLILVEQQCPMMVSLFNNKNWHGKFHFKIFQVKVNIRIPTHDSIAWH